MLTAEREQRILHLLEGSAVVAVTDLAAQLGVSVATVRRDLQSLDGRGLLRRVHGGATSRPLVRQEPLFQDKENLHAGAKAAIARAALARIADRDQIYLDGGSTVLMLAKLLHERRDLTIVTNSLMAAAALMNSPHRLILVGGEFRRLSRTLVGPLTAPLIGGLHLDKAFMGTIGFDLGSGMTTTDPNEAFTKEQVLKRASQVFLLADSSKLGAPSFARSGVIEDVDVLITEKLATGLRRELQTLGVEVVLANA